MDDTLRMEVDGLKNMLESLGSKPASGLFSEQVRSNVKKAVTDLQGFLDNFWIPRGPQNGAEILSHPSPTPSWGRRCVACMSLWGAEVVLDRFFGVVSGSSCESNIQISGLAGIHQPVQRTCFLLTSDAV